MQPEGDELAAAPAGARAGAAVAPRRRADRLLEDVAIAVLIELVRRPRERRDGIQPPDVVDIEPDVHEAAIVAARGSHPRDARRRRRVVGANRVAIDARRRPRVERSAVQRVERRERSVDVDRRSAVERKVDVFFVFVLAEKARGAARGIECQGNAESAETAKNAESRCGLCVIRVRS